MTASKRRLLTEHRRRLPEGDPLGIEDIHDALVIREGDAFLFTDQAGDVPLGNDRGYGFYHSDARHLSGFHFYFHTSPPVVLLSTAERGFASEHVLTNPRLRNSNGQDVPPFRIQLHRHRVISDVLEETIQVTSYHDEPVTLELHFELEADFADIFEVRGHEPKRRGRLGRPQESRDDVTYEYHGIDGQVRRTVVAFEPRPHVLSAEGAVFQITLSQRETWTGHVTVAFANGEATSGSRNTRDRFQSVASSHERWLAECTQVVTDNELFNQVLRRSLSDLRMLWQKTDEGVQYPAAGTPWFDALFGRDSLIVSFQTLAFRPEIARETLKALARWQGTELDPWRDEEPGKILHEYRRGEVSRSGELPFGPYFGSIDSTPLFLLLAAEYYAWTGDLRLMQRLRPNLLAAIDWLDNSADLNRGGLVEYTKQSDQGLVNQGWKDSHDAVVHADGSLADPPIALIEVQGYVYAAKRGLGPVLEALGLGPLAQRLAREARALSQQVHDSFWVADERFFALALDGSGRPCAAITSNVGHALWTGLVSRERAPDAVKRMLANDLSSGWGIRTMSSSHPRYNPLGYHLGTVWPHDNAIAGFGFKKYGFEDELNEVATGLFDAALGMPYYRLPELFSGEARDSHQTAVPYPMACRPQGWAAGAFPMLIHAILGLRADATKGVLQVVRPRLPSWLNTVNVRHLRVGQGHVDLQFSRRGQRTQLEVLATSGQVQVSRTRRWPL